MPTVFGQRKLLLYEHVQRKSHYANAPFQGDSIGNCSARSSPARQSVTNANTYYHLTLHYYQVRLIMPPSPFEGGGGNHYTRSEYIFSGKNPNRLSFFLAARHSNGGAVQIKTSRHAEVAFVLSCHNRHTQAKGHTDERSLSR